MNMNPEHKHEPGTQTLKNEHDCHEMIASQQNITTCQDMSHETYFHAWRPNY